jgi:hypothetical protein
MILDIFAEEGGVGETKAVANELDAKVGLTQVIADILQYLLCNPFVGGLARILLADSGKVFGRDTKLVGIYFYRLTLHIVGVQQVEKVLEVTFAS